MQKHCKYFSSAHSFNPYLSEEKWGPGRLQGWPKVTQPGSGWSTVWFPVWWDWDGKLERRLRDRSGSYWKTDKSRLWVLLPPGAALPSPAHPPIPPTRASLCIPARAVCQHQRRHRGQERWTRCWFLPTPVETVRKTLFEGISVGKRDGAKLRMNISRGNSWQASG